jgi:hypothetical protein
VRGSASGSDGASDATVTAVVAHRASRSLWGDADGDGGKYERVHAASFRRFRETDELAATVRSFWRLSIVM